MAARHADVECATAESPKRSIFSEIRGVAKLDDHSRPIFLDSAHRGSIRSLNESPLTIKNFEGSNEGDSLKAAQTSKAILTDVQFWIPVGVLTLGIGLLIALH